MCADNAGWSRGVELAFTIHTRAILAVERCSRPMLSASVFLGYSPCLHHIDRSVSSAIACRAKPFPALPPIPPAPGNRNRFADLRNRFHSRVVASLPLGRGGMGDDTDMQAIEEGPLGLVDPSDDEVGACHDGGRIGHAVMTHNAVPC